MKEEIRASHLLIGLPKEANPEDTLKAYQQAKALREQLVSGGDFATLARNHSQTRQPRATAVTLGILRRCRWCIPSRKRPIRQRPGKSPGRSGPVSAITSSK